MRSSAGSAGSQNLEGILRESSAVREEVIDRAPPTDPHRQNIEVPPKQGLQPSHLDSDRRRWSCVIQELFGKNTFEQLWQMGRIGVVILLRTMLQVHTFFQHVSLADFILAVVTGIPACAVCVSGPISLSLFWNSNLVERCRNVRCLYTLE